MGNGDIKLKIGKNKHNNFVMQLNRRNFLKIAGAAGVGSMLTGKLTGSELPHQQQPPAKQLKSN